MGDDLNSESNNSFYDTQINPATNNEVNYIANQAQAEELAYLEANMGRNVALNREEELREGITEDEKNNVKFVEQMSEKYPYAFEEIVNPEDGTKVLYYKDAINTGSGDGISQSKDIFESDFWKNNGEVARELYQKTKILNDPRLFNYSHVLFSQGGMFLISKEIGKQIPKEDIFGFIKALKGSDIQIQQGVSIRPDNGSYRDRSGRVFRGVNMTRGLFDCTKEQAEAYISAIKLSNMYHKYVYDNTADVRESKRKASADDIFNML